MRAVRQRHVDMVELMLHHPGLEIDAMSAVRLLDEFWVSGVPVFRYVTSGTCSVHCT